MYIFYLERRTLPKWRSSLVFALYCSSLPAYNEIYNWLVHDSPAWFESKYLRLSEFQKEQSWMSVFRPFFNTLHIYPRLHKCTRHILSLNLRLRFPRILNRKNTNIFITIYSFVSVERNSGIRTIWRCFSLVGWGFLIQRKLNLNCYLFGGSYGESCELKWKFGGVKCVPARSYARVVVQNV